VEFSHRIDSAVTANRLTQAVRARLARAEPLLDLTESNPTRAGFDYPPDLLAALSDRAALAYAPEPLGLRGAREAIAADYARRGQTVHPDRVALTASTSEAYSLLFKVLCDPGDEVLVPQPSYPLFEHLTRLEALVARPYALEYHGAWTIDATSVAAAWSPRTRAVLVVTPNNPTGSLVGRDEWTWLSGWSAERGAAIIADEVFADYELRPGAAAAAAQVLRPGEDGPALVFSLGGLSKSVGLPQLKLGWIAVGGPRQLVHAALHRLEFACDTYLSVSTPVQLAAADLLQRGAMVRDQIRRRIVDNDACCRDLAARCPALDVLAADGGWYAVMQVPSLEPEDDLVVRLVEEHGVIVHPGYFYDFPSESYLVVSLLPPRAAFESAIARIVRHFDCIDRPATP
jgi:hypothetical protein